MTPPKSRGTLPLDQPDTRIRVSKPRTATNKHGSISKSSRLAHSPIEALRKAEALERTLVASPESLRDNTALERDRMNLTTEEPTLPPINSSRAQANHEMMLLEESNNNSI